MNLKKFSLQSSIEVSEASKSMAIPNFDKIFFLQRNSKDAPVVLWLQGGPGTSSMLGLFLEIGPFSLRRDHFSYRKYSWNLDQNLIFIDNPVGTGFSFTADESGYSTNATHAMTNVLVALHQFFDLFPHLRTNEFFLTGESYAGKYVPTLGHLIHHENLNATTNQTINLRGLAIGNAFVDPRNQNGYGEYLYQLGLIDYLAKEKFDANDKKIQEYIDKHDNEKAVKEMAFMYSSLFSNATGFDFNLNLLFDKDPYGYEYEQWLDKKHVRRAIHVGNQTFVINTSKVSENMYLDQPNSVAPYLAELLEHYPVLVYSGQLDLNCPYPLMVNYLKKLEWSGKNKYARTERKRWMVRDKLAGYTRKVGNLTEVLVRNAGHFVPTDQPEFAYDLIFNFIRHKDL